MTFKKLLGLAVLVLLVVLASIFAGLARAAEQSTKLCNTYTPDQDFVRYLGYVPVEAGHLSEDTALREALRLQELAKGRGYLSPISSTDTLVFGVTTRYKVCILLQESEPRWNPPAMDSFHVAFADLQAAADAADFNREMLQKMRSRLEQFIQNLPK